VSCSKTNSLNQTCICRAQLERSRGCGEQQTQKDRVTLKSFIFTVVSIIEYLEIHSPRSSWVLRQRPQLLCYYYKTGYSSCNDLPTSLDAPRKSCYHGPGHFCTTVNPSPLTLQSTFPCSQRKASPLQKYF
jgi:hypothetical protein